MSKNVFTTLDAYQAAYLVLRGHSPELLQEGPKIIFAFNSSPNLFKHISDYQSGAEIEALRLANAVKLLKSQIFARKKMENGFNYGKNF